MQGWSGCAGVVLYHYPNLVYIIIYYSYSTAITIIITTFY